MFRGHVLIIRRSKLHCTASGIITPIGQNSITQPLESSHLYTASGIITPIGQNSITQPLESSHLYTASGIITPIGVMIPEAV